MTTNEPRPAGYNGAVFIPVPDGMTYTQALDALADAGKWVEMEDFGGIPDGVRVRTEWALGRSPVVRYVHRDDLPHEPEPDAELIERMCEAMWGDAWGVSTDDVKSYFREKAAQGLAVVREHD